MEQRISARGMRVAIACLIVYGIALAMIALWPVPVDRGADRFLALVTRLFPVLTYARIEFGANILLFIPLGILLTVLVPRARWIVLPIALVATVTIESIQALVLDQRTPSILDIIANTTGACVGMLMVVLIERLRAGAD